MDEKEVKVENEEEEITEEELIRRIIEYKKYKEITKKLKEAFLVNSNRLFKMPEEIELPKQKIQKDYTPNIIPEVYQKLLQTNAEKINENAANIEKIAITETFSVGDKVKDMYRALIKYKKFTFNKLFSIFTPIEFILGTFICLLLNASVANTSK